MLKEHYQKNVIPQLEKETGIKNKMAIPKITKITVNTGLGRKLNAATKESARKILELVQKDLAAITGQKPVLTTARKSIASFKIREGLVIGAKVTLRGQKMYDFLEKLVYVALPRTRDFRGIDEKNVDKGGNLSIGIKEHTVFPEIIQEKERQVFGLQVIINTTAKKREDALALFKLMDVPFKKSK